MSSPEEGGRSALEESAREAVRALPPEARVIGIPAVGGPDAARAVVALASASGELRGRTLLANLEEPHGDLDSQVGVVGSPGLASVVRGAADLTDAATRPEDLGFLYLPGDGGPDRKDAGEGEASPLAEDPSARALLAESRFRRLAGRVRRADGTLLLHLAPGDLAGADLDGFIRVGEPALPPDLTLEELARIPLAHSEGSSRPPAGEGEAEPDAAPEAPSEGSRAEDRPPRATGTEPSRQVISPPSGTRKASGGWGRHRRSAGPPLLKIGGGAIVVLGLLAGWWFLADGLLPGVDGGDDGGSSPAAVMARSGPGEEAAGEAADRWREVAERAPELPFSVLIASYGSLPGALERLDEWEAGDAVPLLAPTPVRGRLYYRLFAGVRQDRDAADALMRGLVRSGEKERASEWDVRPVPLSFRLGIHAEREGAEAELRDLREDRIPAFLVPVAAGTDTAWQVYAGAYDSPESAAPLREDLVSSGREAELVARRGLPR